MSNPGSRMRRLYCAKPACGRPLDWAAPVCPKKDTPGERVHEVLCRHDYERCLLCYACGHYTTIRQVTIRTERRNGYIEIVAEADIVNSAFLHFILDDMAEAGIRLPGVYLKLLLEVIAPRIDISPMQALQVFKRAVELGLRGSQVAYLISGRKWTPAATVVESIARARGIHFRFFLDRHSALQWLNVSDEAGRIA